MRGIGGRGVGGGRGIRGILNVHRRSEENEYGNMAKGEHREKQCNVLGIYIPTTMRRLLLGKWLFVRLVGGQPI